MPVFSLSVKVAVPGTDSLKKVFCNQGVLSLNYAYPMYGKFLQYNLYKLSYIGYA